ncbi:hypothetical protein [Azonexus sp.]|jgi:hypothetical protein|uniref:hypothetical protein n=1 Tax=Azonexus sp. TaxID=1872668 RepID=UPI002836D75C|nr:hypothetical protein [Azonexus sp.]MDR1996236.1 hypothetical protein [Azonexus sp.]
MNIIWSCLYNNSASGCLAGAFLNPAYLCGDIIFNFLDVWFLSGRKMILWLGVESLGRDFCDQ